MGIGYRPGPFAAHIVDKHAQINVGRPMTYEAAIDRLLRRLKRDVPLLLDWPEVIELEQTLRPPARNKLDWRAEQVEGGLSKDLWIAEYNGHVFQIERGRLYKLYANGQLRSEHATLIGAQQRAELLID